MIEAIVSVIFGLNVNVLLRIINIGMASIPEPIKYLKSDTGRSAVTFPVCPFTVAYATLSLLRYDKNHTGNIALSSDATLVPSLLSLLP